MINSSTLSIAKGLHVYRTNDSVDDRLTADRSRSSPCVNLSQTNVFSEKDAIEIFLSSLF